MKPNFWKVACPFLWFALCAVLWVSPFGTANAGAKKKPSKTRAVKKSLSSLALHSWPMMKHVFETGSQITRDLLLSSASQNLKKLEVRSRVQWNAGSLARFANAYMFYVKKLSDTFPKHASTWKKWRQRARSLGLASKLLRESALVGKPKVGLKGSLLALKLWKKSTLGATPKTLRGKKLKLVLDVISGLSTGIEFTSFHRLRQMERTLATQPKAIVALKSFLRPVKKYRLNFRTLRKKLSGKWTMLFVYHAELLFRATVYLGRASLAKGTKQQKMKNKYRRYVTMLNKSLRKANQSFAKFWRTAK